MIRAKDIQDKLLHLIGWQQNYDTSDIKISENLTISESGIYFQQVHPLLTLQNLLSIAPDFANTTYQSYNNETQYDKGNVVKYNDKLYKALSSTINEWPDMSNNWIETNPFSEWLEYKTKSGIHKAIMRFYNEKVVKKEHFSLCENKTLFNGTCRLSDTITNKNNFVGFELVPIRSMGVTVKINKICLHFTKPGKYTLYLFHSSSDSPIRVLQLEKVKENSAEWFSFDDLYLPYMSDDTDSGGSWYLCYFQSSLPQGSMAIRKNIDWSKGPCGACSKSERISWEAWSKFLEVHPFLVNEENMPNMGSFNYSYSNDFQVNPPMWDISNNQYTYDSNYGINLEITVQCDITDFIINQRMLFQDIISKQIAIDMLREFAYNPNARTNRHSINASRPDILYEIDGDSSSIKKSGLSYQLDMAFAAISLNTEGLDRICLPCRNNGVKYRTI